MTKLPAQSNEANPSTGYVEDILNTYAKNISSMNNLEFLNNCTHIGKFRIKSVLGTGGQAVCLLAQDDDLQRPVVIKLYREGLADDYQKQILREGCALAKIKSPFVAQCYGAEWFRERPFLVLEYVEGKTLTDWIADRPANVETAFRIVEQLAQGLEAVHHNQLLHLDIKPDNVIIDKNQKAVLIDFGLSQPAFAAPPQRVAGTPSFLAPERMLRCDVDHRADIYGLGAILFFLLCGKAPVEGSSKAQVLEKLAQQPIDLAPLDSARAPKIAIDICKQSLASDPMDRIENAASFRQLLNTRPKDNRHLKLLAVAALVLVFSAACLTVSTGLWNPKLSKTTPSSLPGKTALSQLAAVAPSWIHNPNGDHPFKRDFEISFRLGVETKPNSAEWKNLTEWTTLTNRTLSPIKLRSDGLYQLSMDSDQPCYISIFSCEYEPNSTKINLVKTVYDRDYSMPKAKSLNWEFNQTIPTPQGQCEYIWVVASNVQIKEEEFALAVTEQLVDPFQKADRQLVQSSILRGVEESQDNSDLVWISEMVIPYQSLPAESE